MICPVCSNTAFHQIDVLKPRLIEEWNLNENEVRYINEQQGLRCTKCKCNLRSMNIANAIIQQFRLRSNLQISSFLFTLNSIRILEINRAGDLHYIFERTKKHTFAEYPNVDMQKLPFENNSFDLIVHSDTLEHVENSKQALLENFRVLKENGSLIYTIPVIYGRLTLDRHGLSNSYHGSQDENQGEDYKVWKEYGSDFWLELVEVGFSEIKITTINGLNSFAVIATKRTNINYSKSHYFYKIYSFLVLIKNIIQK